jgi:hypothetical protein
VARPTPASSASPAPGWRIRAHRRASAATSACWQQVYRLVARRRPRGGPAMTGPLRRWPALGLLAIVAAVFSALSPEFLSARNLVNVLVQSASLGIVATGMAFVLLTAGPRSRPSRGRARPENAPRRVRCRGPPRVVVGAGLAWGPLPLPDGPRDGDLRGGAPRQPAGSRRAPLSVRRRAASESGAQAPAVHTRAARRHPGLQAPPLAVSPADRTPVPHRPRHGLPLERACGTNRRRLRLVRPPQAPSGFGQRDARGGVWRRAEARRRARASRPAR